MRLPEPRLILFSLDRMRSSFLPSLRDVAYYAAGYATGSVFFCGAYMWTYSGTIPGIIVALGTARGCVLFRTASGDSFAQIRSGWSRGLVCLWHRRRPLPNAGPMADLHVAAAVRARTLCNSHRNSHRDSLLGPFRHAKDESDACSLTKRCSQPLSAVMPRFAL